MAGSTAPPKDPIKVRAGRIGADVRWRQPRVVSLTDLTGEQRRLVLALIDAARAGREKVASDAA